MPWPFYTASEKTQKALQSRVNDLQLDLIEARNRVTLLSARVDTLETSLASLAAQHERLRGALYGLKGGGRPPAGGAPAPQGRDALRALAGIRAGQPFPHTSEE